MAVIVGTALQLGEDGIASPSAVFLISMTGSFFIAACLHPQEFWCIVPGIIYLLSIPAMYLLLIIYSITNLNVVSWGTREVAVKKTKKEMEEERKDAATEMKNAKNMGGIWAFLSRQQEEVDGHINFNIGDLLQIKLFNREKNNASEMLAFHEISEKLEMVLKKLEDVERYENGSLTVQFLHGI
jgi:chitin synthase